MRKLAFGAMFGLLVAACGGGGGVTIIDASQNPPDAGTTQCNAATQTGCAANEKCTWINIDSANNVGTVGCVPNGTVAEGAACTVGADGQTTGYDNCVAGDICISGACEAICTTAPDNCDTATGVAGSAACSNYEGLFTGTTPQLGACDFKCDPVAQTRTFDNAAQCGHNDGTFGCYPTPGADSFSCADVPAGAAGKTQDVQAYGPDATHAYANGCEAGYGPLMKDPTLAFAVCVAFCSPHTTDTQDTTAPGGISNNANGQYSCGDRQATSSQCRFYWIGEQANPPLYPDVGYCDTWSLYTGVGDVDCTTIDPTADNCCDANGNPGTGDGTHDYIQYGCAAFGSTLTGTHQKIHNMLTLPTTTAKALR